MRFCLLIMISGLMAACASKNKTAAPAPATATEQAVASTKTVATKASAAAAKLECTHGADARVLELRGKDKGCELGYTKGGKEAVVATSINGSSHCENTMNKMKDKLQASGFSCK